MLKPRLDLFLLVLLAPLFVHSQSPKRWLDDIKNTWWTSKACTIWPNMACVESSVKPQPTKQYRVVQMLSGHWPLWIKKMSYVSRSCGDTFTVWWDYGYYGVRIRMLLDSVTFLQIQNPTDFQTYLDSDLDSGFILHHPSQSAISRTNTLNSCVLKSIQNKHRIGLELLIRFGV